MATTLLTQDEWEKASIKPPFRWIKVANKAWGIVERQMIVKWLEAHVGKGWVYWNGESRYVFQNAGDLLAFKMWIKSDPFAEDEGEIE